MGPEESMRIQSNLGSDIAMAFDECVENPATYPICQGFLRADGALAGSLQGGDGPINLAEPDAVNPGQHALGHQSGRDV